MGSVRNATRLWNKQIFNSRRRREKSKSVLSIERTMDLSTKARVIREQANEEKSD